MTVAARLDSITKRFGPVTALDAVDFELAPGEIHGLLGENGAGKTTLACVLGGLLAPDAGVVEIGGRTVALRSARDARELGVAMVHQHFSLVPRFTGFENVALFNGEAWTRRGTVERTYRKRVEARARELRLDVALDEPVAGLGVGQRQRIEILKALMSETRVLLLDEPTAVLAPQEVDGLFAVLREVAGAGAAIVLVAHKLDEVLAVADRVTVLRRGRRVLTEDAAAVSARGLAEAMIGEALGDGAWGRGGAGVRRGAGGRGGAGVRSEAGGRGGMGDREAGGRGGAGDHGGPAATLTGVTVDSPGAYPLRDVDLTVRRGEILGIAGVDGNGQRALAAVLAGMVRPDSGTAVLPREVGWIPQDRGEEGLVRDFTITENVALALHAKAAYRRGPWLDWAGIGERSAALVDEMDVRAGSTEARARTLSGGNQQRVVAGREFLRAGELLVAESPTRGLDVKATRVVRARIADLVKAGDRPPAVVLISADLDEVLELADRIAVMVRGRLIPVRPEDHNPTAIGALMLSAGDPGT